MRRGKPLSHRALSQSLEGIRAKHASDKIQIDITGFAKVVGDLIDWLLQPAACGASAGFGGCAVASTVEKFSNAA